MSYILDMYISILEYICTSNTVPTPKYAMFQINWNLDCLRFALAHPATKTYRMHTYAAHKFAYTFARHCRPYKFAQLHLLTL